MSPRVTPPFRADHAGTLLRPPELISVRERFHAQQSSAEELRSAEDRAVTEVVAAQEELGLQPATDGEFRRDERDPDFTRQLDGVEVDSDSGMRVTGKIGLSDPAFAAEFTALADRATTSTPKLTIPSPGMLARLDRAAVSADAYPDPDLSSFRADVAGAFARQVRGLSDLGCHYLQIDDTAFAALDADPSADPRLQRRQLVEMVNTAVADRPETAAVTLRLARDHHAPWITEGGHDATAETLFTGLAVDGFFLEAPDPAAADFSALRFVPKDRAVVLGLVDPSAEELETKDALKRQVETAARYVDGEQLCLAPQRGFPADAGMGREQQLAKLRLVTETAREIWG